MYIQLSTIDTFTSSNFYILNELISIYLFIHSSIY